VLAPEISYARDLSNVVKENASLRFARLTKEDFGGSSVGLRSRVFLWDFVDSVVPPVGHLSARYSSFEQSRPFT